MNITSKGQVTIPLKIRKILGITYHSEVDFVEKNGEVMIIKAKSTKNSSRLKNLKGRLKGKFTTDEIMNLTRGES